jgi:hemerythrin
MAHVQWKDRYNVNYKDIDDQHKNLVGILNDLIDLVSERGDSSLVGPIFHRLFEYTQVHFAYEERFMRKARYVGGLAHKAEHQGFIQKLLELNQRYDPGNPMLLEETLAFLQQWYLNHITDMDMKYAPFMRGLYDKCQIKGIVFDSNSVVFPFDLHRFGEGLAALAGTSADSVLSALGGEPDLLRGYARGSLSSADFAARAAELCGAELAEGELAGAYAGSFTPASQVLDLLPRLKPACKIGLVAAGGEWLSERVLDPCPGIACFDGVTLSCRLGAAAGNPLLLEDTLDKLDLISEECLLVSADQAFLAEAKQHLFHTLPFTEGAGLEAGLRQAGVGI